MKTTSKLWTLALAASVLSFSSCQEDEAITESSLAITDQTESVADSEGILVPSTATMVDASSSTVSSRKEVVEVEEFAKLLAASLKDREMRTFLKEEANKQFDGDYDILVSNVVDAEIGDESFSEKLTGSTENSNVRTSNVVDAATKNPKLNISVPVLIEDWQDQKQKPLVAISLGAVEGETEFIKAYDSNGQEYLLDANVEPDVPVIVVGNNERMAMIEEFKKSKDNSNNAKRSGRIQQVDWLRCPNLNDIESWYFGGPEIRFDGVAYSVSGSSTFQAFSKTRTPSRDQAKDGYYFTQDLFRWYFDGSSPSHGPNYYIQSWEIDDSGTTYKLGVSVTAGVKIGDNVETKGTASFEISYKAQDKKLPGQLINYQDPTQVIISDSYLQFRMKEGL